MAGPLELRVFPNPVFDNGLNLFFQSLDRDLNVEFTFYDLLGNKISENSITLTPLECDVEFDMSNFPQGPYILRVESSAITQSLRIIRN